MGSPTYNWEALRDRYVTGNEDLRTIAEEPTTPAKGTLFTRSAREDWPAQRKAYRQHVASKTRTTVASEAAEVAARHVRIAKGMQAKGLAALQLLEPERLTPYQAMRLLQLGADIERRALGMGDNPVDQVELSELTLDQLRRVAQGEDPRKVTVEGA